MRNIIAGTAGHIDHGKTALVRALTGIDTDRLEEEKRRGISIDLGFAHLELPPDLRIGFVDVPGHERFIKNMLAGVGGIDVVLFVIAADESIKPQTREHFDICRLLGIQRGLIVLTKRDLVDPDVLDLVRLEVEEYVAGSFLEGAPMVAVSAATGEGIGELRSRLSEVASLVPPKDASSHFRLPIDRCFSMRGFGTVVTGTLISGSVSREQEVEVHPGGRRLRVRGIQVHDRAEECAFAGQRTALNLAGAEPSELTRGMVLTLPGLFRPTARIDCAFELLPSARPLKHRAPVHFHGGAAEIEGEALLLDGSSALAPGGRAFVRIRLREPALILPGDRFIVRMFSPVVTIGGGIALDVRAEGPPRKANTDGRLKILAEGGAPERIGLFVREARYGMSVEDLVARTGLRQEEIERTAHLDRFVYFEQPKPWLVDRGWFEQALSRIASTVGEFHQRNPLLAGMPKEDLRGSALPGSPPFLLDAMLERTSELAAQGEAVRLQSHSLVLKEDEEQALSAIEESFARAGLAVPGTKEVLARSGVGPARALNLLQILLRQKRLIRIGEDLVFHAGAIESLRRMLAARKGQRFRVPAFKDWTGISRKYAIPLLEYLDRERVTRREGDERVVL